MPVKLKLGEDGYVVVQDGKPVVIYEDGKEAAFDIDHTLSTIGKLNGEAMGHRKAFEAVEGKLKLFEGIEDPDEARNALTTVKNLSGGELKTAEQVAEMQKAAQKASEEQVKAALESGARDRQKLQSERDKLQNELTGERLGAAFTRSGYVKDKLLVPVDMVQSMFAGRFKIEDNKVVGHDASGNKIYSRARVGEVANFDEAMEQIVDAYPNREHILKGAGNSGSGARGSNGGGGGPNTITRAEFDRLSPTEKMTAAKSGKQVVDA